MCSKHVEAWNKLTVKQKFCISSWLITEINILRYTISKTSKNEVIGFVIYKRVSNFVLRLQIPDFGIAIWQPWMYILLPFRVLTFIEPKDDPSMSKHVALINIKTYMFWRLHFMWLNHNITQWGVLPKGNSCRLKGKSVPLQARRGSEASRFRDNGTGWWQACQPYAPAVFTPRKYSWHSFLLEA